MQIIVLGMHRAGTSLTTRIINMMGAYVGPAGMLLAPSPDNPKGFWERKDVMNLNAALLQHFNANWYQVASYAGQPGSVPEPMRETIRTIVNDLNAHQPWVIKDPRLCMTLPCWLPELESPVAVIASREPLAVAQSLHIRNAMPLEYGLALWEYYAVHIIRSALDLPKVFTRYETMLASPMETVRKLHDGLLAQDVRGITLPAPEAVAEFIEPGLQRVTMIPIAPTLSNHQKLLAAMLLGEAPFDADVVVSDASREVMKDMRNTVSGAPVNH